jgi:hypothetical protein
MLRPKQSAALGVNNSTKKRVALIVAVGLLSLLLVGLALIRIPTRQRQSALRVTGPLSTNDVAEITKLILRERAPVSGELAPKNARGWEIRLRERVTAQIRSISSRNGRTANVDFVDGFNTNIGYDYDLERTTNGWKVIGVGSYEKIPRAVR